MCSRSMCVYFDEQTSTKFVSDHFRCNNSNKESQHANNLRMEIDGHLYLDLFRLILPCFITSGLLHCMLTCDQRCSNNRSVCLVFPHQLSVVSTQGVQIGVNSSYKQQTTFIQPWRRPNRRTCLETPHE